MLRVCLGLATGLALLCLVSISWCQDVPVAVLNNTAVELSIKGEYQEAIRIWRSLVERTGPEHPYAWVLHKNIGRNYQKLGRYVEAWWHLGESLRLGTGDEKAVTQWRSEVEEELRRERVHVRIESVDAATEVRLGDGEDAAWYAAPTEWWLGAGAYRIAVRGKGEEQSEVCAEVAPSAETAVLVLPAAGKLVVEPDPESAEVAVDGGRVGAGRVEAEFPAGRHSVVVSLQGHTAWSQDVTVAGGCVVTARAVLEKLEGGPLEPRGSSPGVAEGPTGSGAGGVASWKWLVLGGGAVAAIGGVITWNVALSNRDAEESRHMSWRLEAFPPDGRIVPGQEELVARDWNSRLDSHVAPYEKASWLLWGVGGAALVAGAALVIPDLLSGEETGPLVPVPTLIPGGGGAGAVFFF